MDVDDFWENEKMQKKNAFKQKFAEINSTLKSIADVFNHTSVNNTRELQLTDNQTITEDSDPNLMILQLSIFDKTNTMQTILTAPYFLVVGYPNTDQIRLTTYDTGDEGRKMPIDQINSQLIEESVLEFLQKNV